MATQLNMAEQQLLGWHSAKHGVSLTSLVKAMGLTEKEWLKMCDSDAVSYLTDEEFAELDNYFYDTSLAS